jgi:hypothetical protein
MNWYKRAQEEKEDRWQWDEGTMLDYYETHDDTIRDQVYNFNDSAPGSRQSWRLIPLPRIKKIWLDYMKMGFVRDVKGIQLIEDIIIENVRKVHANTILTGHTEQHPEDFLEENEMTMNETDEHDYGDWAADDRGAMRISDYALGNLINGTLELMHAKTPEQKLQKIDFILNVVHQRSDIAGWFIEKGVEGLDELGNQSFRN